MKSCLKNLVYLLSILLLFSVNAFANTCACCSEKGYYSISYSKPTDYQLAEIEMINFASSVNRYTDVADDIKGISTVADTYDLTGSFLKTKWNLTFKTANKSGILTLPLPNKMLSYIADTHENDAAAEERGLGPVLYKEWRFEGTVSGTGIFQAGIAPMTKYFLVLQGRGNLCDSSADFTHWRLEITGKKASYAFYGNLKND